MTFETVVPELFESFPSLQEIYKSQFEYLSGEPPLAYVVFGSLLIPALDNALANGDLACVSSMCSYLEKAAQSSSCDARLANLLSVEIGEWLGQTPLEGQVALYLGPETKRICRYVPELATQRWKSRIDKETSTLRRRIRLFFKGR
jgi:hypothetical protein